MLGLSWGLVELLFPGICPGCGAALRVRHDTRSLGVTKLQRLLCPDCHARLGFLSMDACASCQEVSAPGVGAGCMALRRCHRCAGTRSPLASCTARIRFDAEAEKWIHAFKYPAAGLRGLRPGWDEVVAGLALEAAAQVPGGQPDLVIPVPLHVRRLRKRGFNPAATLARAVASQFGARYSASVLKRLRDTPSQTGLGRRARRENVRDVFQLIDRSLPARIWIVDDVVTTGSTIEEAARALQHGGARHVHGVAAARAIRFER